MYLSVSLFSALVYCLKSCCKIIVRILDPIIEGGVQNNDDVLAHDSVDLLVGATNKQHAATRRYHLNKFGVDGKAKIDLCVD